MKEKSQITDALLILISAWAVVATSLDRDYRAFPVESKGHFSVQSTCDTIDLSQGEITVTPWSNGTYTFSLATDFGFPSDYAREIVVDSNGGGDRIISLDGDARSCQAKIDDELFNIPSAIPFLCYDGKSPDVACAITLKLLYLEESSGEKTPSEPAPPVDVP
ncbi:MAG: hypothetical protein EOP07_08890 [Proteobacteria bacterium]|nr:MAG: hypothetical protein EOP07_08890 [Pseudomonadota bacterium]